MNEIDVGDSNGVSQGSPAPSALSFFASPTAGDFDRARALASAAAGVDLTAGGEEAFEGGEVTSSGPSPDASRPCSALLMR